MVHVANYRFFCVKAIKTFRDRITRISFNRRLEKNISRNFGIDNKCRIPQILKLAFVYATLYSNKT